MRKTWVSTTTPSALPNETPRTTLAVLRAAPGMVMSSARVWGTWPLNSETTLRAAPWMDFALLWKKPVVRIIFSSSARGAVDIAWGGGKSLNNSGVSMLTRMSVHWAERIVATRSSQGELWVRAQSTAG